MKNIYSCLKLCLLLVIPFLLSSCEKEEFLMSNSKIDNQISHTWKKLMNTEGSVITWKFEKGNVCISKNGIQQAKGNYSVNCTMSKAEVTMSGFPEGYEYLNLTWMVLSLDGQGLAITDLKKGTQEYEFQMAD